ncbi:MAG: hypothetical protein MMC23_004416 [Stictis urceolatum]|nr:hypothetical protein [Stictis urceolata]
MVNPDNEFDYRHANIDPTLAEPDPWQPYLIGKPIDTRARRYRAGESSSRRQRQADVEKVKALSNYFRKGRKLLPPTANECWHFHNDCEWAN